MGKEVFRFVPIVAVILGLVGPAHAVNDKQIKASINAAIAFLKSQPTNVQQGTVAIPEAGVTLSPGDVFCEVGLFAPHGRRTAGAVCATDCRLLTLSGPKLLELCYQDAKLAVFLARLLAGYVYAETSESCSGA